MNMSALSLKPEYRSPQDDVVKEVFIPALKFAKSYKRAVGYFSSTSLAEITKGISGLVENRGTIQIVASPALSESDEQAIKLGYEKRKEVIEKKLLGELDKVENDYFNQERLNLLANLIANNVLDLKIAFTDTGKEAGIYHEKLGIFEDFEGNKIAFDGSMNESVTAMRYNYESVNVYCSWKQEDCERINSKIKAFENIWNNTDISLDVVDFPSVTQKILDRYKRKDLKSENISKEAKWLDNQELYEKSGIYNIPADKLLCLGEPKINVPRMPEWLQLHDYQKEAIDNWESNNFRGIFDMATGTGKTLTGLSAMVRLSEALDNKLAVFIVCPYQHLVEQWVSDIIEFGVEPIIGYSESKQKDWKTRLKEAVLDQRFVMDKNFFCFVSTNATFSSNFVQQQIQSIKSQALLLVDEAHNFGAEYLRQVLSEKFEYRLALSATLNRHGDAEGTAFLHKYFGKKCIEYDLARAIKEGKLTPYRYHPVITNLTESELDIYQELSKQIAKCIVNGKLGIKLNEKGKRLALERARLVAGASEKISVLEREIRPYINDKHILVYCGATRVFDENFCGYSESEQAEDIAESKRQIDVITDLLGNKLNMKVSQFTSKENMQERAVLLKEFSEGKNLQVLIAIKCLDEGVNIPEIKTAFILASTTNPKEYIQRRGRVLRKSTGKTYADIYDFITLPRHLNDVYGLTKTAKEEDESLVRKELIRAYEFANIASNKMEALEILNKIKELYDIEEKDLVINEEMKYE